MRPRVYLCGIGGIGMANFAAILKEVGYDVSGSDGAIYEPAASVLRSAGIAVRTPYATDNVPLDGTPLVIGNALFRGHIEVETALDARVPLYSFPEFLRRSVLQQRAVVVVAGTHGKSTTTACLAHLLSASDPRTGFLVGALPINFPLGAQLGAPDGPFVIEGDEYDTAFFDKRSKFLHYFPSTLVLGSIEYDHADIFSSRDEMLLAFRRLVNVLPRNGLLVYNADCPETADLARNAPCPTVSVGVGSNSDWRWLESGSDLRFLAPDGSEHTVALKLPGRHNRLNALMSVATAVSSGMSLERALDALDSFRGIRRRFELLLHTAQVVVYDDFAHHPTAIAGALQAAREICPARRLVAVLEPRSNTMVRNVFQKELPEVLAVADEVIIGTIHRLERIPIADRLDTGRLTTDVAARGVPCRQIENPGIARCLIETVVDGPSVVVFMSNGDFGGVPREFVRLVNEHIKH